MTIIMIGTKNAQFGAAGDSRTIVDERPHDPAKKTFSLYGGKIVGAFEYNMSLARKTMGEWIIQISEGFNYPFSLQEFIDLFVPEYELILNNTRIDQFNLEGRSSKVLLVSKKDFSGAMFEMALLHFTHKDDRVELNTRPHTIYFECNDKRVSTGNANAKIAAEKFFDDNVNRIDDIKVLLKESIAEGIKSANDISIGDEPTVEIGIS